MSQATVCGAFNDLGKTYHVIYNTRNVPLKIYINIKGWPMDLSRECPQCGKIFSSPEITLVQCPTCKNIWLVEDISTLELFEGYLNEIRHPYASIKGFTDLLKERQFPEEEQDKWLTTMSQIIESLENLRQLLSKYIAQERKKL